MIAFKGGKRFNKKTNVLLLIISYGFLIAEVCFTFNKDVADDSALFLCFLVLIPALMIFALEFHVKNNAFIAHSRSFSKTLYFVHPFVAGLLQAVGMQTDYILFLIVLAICSVVWVIKIKTNNEFLKKFC